MTGSSRARQARGAQARRSGAAAEVAAACWLLLKGWRILAMRSKIAGVEIDLLARRRGVLAVVEVKSRATLAAALAAVSAEQQARLQRAGTALTGRRDLQGLAVRLDLVALAPGRLPRHVADAWPDRGGAPTWRPGR